MVPIYVTKYRFSKENPEIDTLSDIVYVLGQRFLSALDATQRCSTLAGGLRYLSTHSPNSRPPDSEI